jgi:hypothetical protein
MTPAPLHEREAERDLRHRENRGHTIRRTWSQIIECLELPEAGRLFMGPPLSWGILTSDLWPPEPLEKQIPLL